MARPLRIQFEGAIYHVMARGNGKQLVFHGEDDYQRMLTGIEQTVRRTCWEVLAFVLMPNHLHLFFRTPQPNLSKGMQYLLSGYANWYAKRHQRPGHLFQGRFKGELIEDETYFWNVSRYLHLNPTRGKRALVGHPRDWRWSSYRGYARKTERLDWMCYDVVYRAWQGEKGGTNPETAYRRFVESGLAKPVENPFKQAQEGWLLGSNKFVEHISRRLKRPAQPDQVRQFRQLVFSSAEVVQLVADYYGVHAGDYATRGARVKGRDLAAYLAHRRTTATLRELASLFGLSHPDSVSNLTRRAEKALAGSKKLQSELAEIESKLPKT